MYRKVLQGANLLLSWCKAARWCHTKKNHPGSHPMRPFFRLLCFSSKKRHHASISNSDSEKRGTIAFEIPTESFLQKMPPKKNNRKNRYWNIGTFHPQNPGVGRSVLDPGSFWNLYLFTKGADPSRIAWHYGLGSQNSLRQLESGGPGVKGGEIHTYSYMYIHKYIYIYMRRYTLQRER